MSSWWAIRCVWSRYFAIYRKNIAFGITTTFVEPVLYLLSFGFGVGALIGVLKTDGISVTYRQFIFAGIAGQTIMFQAFFESAYGSFVRMYYQKIYQAIGMTPITLSEILWAELIWDSSKATFSASAVLLIGWMVGDFSAWGALAALPFAFVCGFLFAGMGMLSAARSASIDELSYPQFLLIFPMLLFCGVFFPLEQLPVAGQWVAWCLPLTSVVSLFRTLTLGFPLKAPVLVVLPVWLFGAVWFARRCMYRRLVK